MNIDILEFILHLDTHIQALVDLFGIYIYVLLFAIIFAETGLVVTPFLPGDSLLFVVGALAGSGFLNIFVLYITLLTAAILGDTVNYWVGHHLGARAFAKKNSRFFKKEYLVKTEEFYEKHGGKTIILARFLPIIRTFAPFVAGVGKMHYRTFLFYNVVGGFVWVTLLVFAGYFFGGLEVIRNNFEYAIIGIVLLSLLPIVFEYINHRKEKELSKKHPEKTSYKEIRKTLKKDHLSD